MGSKIAREAGRRVLIVDDDEDTRELVEAILHQRGMPADTAANGVEALDCIGKNRYAVILLDLVMPVADGYAVLEELARRDPRSLPVILVVTGADRREVERLDPQVIHGIVRKPFDPADLGALVAACVEIRDRSALETMALAAIAASSWFA